MSISKPKRISSLHANDNFNFTKLYIVLIIINVLLGIDLAIEHFTDWYEVEPVLSRPSGDLDSTEI